MTSNLLSKREQIAAMILQSLLINKELLINVRDHGKQLGYENNQSCSIFAIQMTDALLKELNDEKES